MLNLFAATGHTNYAKSCSLYLQLMLELPSKYPWLAFMRFVGLIDSGLGLSTDLVIEQVMMRALKSRGGLTHGRGMTKTVRLMWVACLHKFGSIYTAMTTLTDLAHLSDEAGYAGMGRARRLRDSQDLIKVLQWFEGSNPFLVLDNRLHSLSTGKAASDNDCINCDKAEDVGLLIMKKMDNVHFSDIVLKKVDQAKTLSDANCKGSVGARNYP